MKNKVHRPAMGPGAPRRIFPIALLAEGKQCLVVGGGKVAERKTHALLDAGAAVAIVSPQARPALRELAAQGRLAWAERKFEPSDVEGVFLAFAATSDAETNLAVLNACRAKGVPCCAVDGSWPLGDFVTPAVFRKSDFVVAVSTGGRSCRKARLLKDSLARHIEAIETADLLVMGIDHERLELEKRETFHLSAQRLEAAGNMLGQARGVHEFMPLNTCNRFELMAAASGNELTINFLRRAVGFDCLPGGAFYLKSGYEAFEHSAMLLAGLLSQARGERHIAAQVKAALDFALSRKWAGPAMKEWFASAAHVARHIRAAVGPMLGNIEVEDVCMEFIKAETRGLPRKRILVIGAGAAGKGAIWRCVKTGARCAWCYHVRRPDSRFLQSGRVELFPADELNKQLYRADVVICAVASDKPVLRREHARFFKRNAGVRVVDLGAPRNVDPGLSKSNSRIRVVNLDGLKQWHNRDSVSASGIRETAKAIVAGHEVMYEKIISSLKGGFQAEQAGAAADP